MNNNLYILPIETSLSRPELERLCSPVLSIFNGIYSEIIIASRLSVSKIICSSVFALDVVSHTPSLINGVPGEGLHKSFGELINRRRDIFHGVAVTDKMISFGGYRAGGSADIQNKTALVTTLEPKLVTLETMCQRVPQREISIPMHTGNEIAPTPEKTRQILSKTQNLENEQSLNELIIRRTRSVIIHELGHLFGLDHHDAMVEGLYCPMVTRSWDDEEYETPEKNVEFMDKRGLKFCPECVDTIFSSI